MEEAVEFLQSGKLLTGFRASGCYGESGTGSL